MRAAAPAGARSATHALSFAAQVLHGSASSTPAARLTSCASIPNGAVSITSVKDHVLALLPTAQTRADTITRAAKDGVLAEAPATVLDLIEVTGALRFAPRLVRVVGDFQQVGLGTPSEAEPRHV